jgi:hypothetical protein
MTDDDAVTIVERLDAAKSGQEFGQVLCDLFDTLARAKDDKEGAA